MYAVKNDISLLSRFKILSNQHNVNQIKSLIIFDIIVNLFSSEARLDIEIGSIYDCAVTYQEGIFRFSQHQDCRKQCVAIPSSSEKHFCLFL